MLKVMKHNCPFCGHDLNGTELGNHINDLEGKVASPPEPDSTVAALHAEMQQLQTLQAELPKSVGLPHFGD